MSRTVARVAVLLLAAAILRPLPAGAVDLDRFYQMNLQAQAEYVAAMVDQAQRGLRAEGQSDAADKVVQLFRHIAPGDSISAGVGELSVLIAKARLADAKRREQNASARPLDVEDALFVLLKNNGITVSDDLINRVFDGMANFHWITNADFLGKPVAEQREIIRWYVAVAFPYYALRLELDKHTDQFFQKDSEDERHQRRARRTVSGFDGPAWLCRHRETRCGLQQAE